MSVLIKGMEMPTSCANCPVNMNICKRGYQYLFAHPELYNQRAEDCPISYVPPHGRLIDGDKLNDYLKTAAMMADGEAKEAYIDARAEARTMAVIIPAEDGET